MSKRFKSVEFDVQGRLDREGFIVTFEKLADLVEKHPDSREKEIVLQKIDEAFMWSGRMLRGEQLTRDFRNKNKSTWNGQ